MSEPTATGDRRYVVISSDDHGGADLRAYKPYLEARWHAEFDEWADQYSNPWVFLDPRVPTEDQDEEDLLLVAASSWHSPLNWDGPKRLAHLESNGVAAEVVFPNTAPPFMPTSVLAGAPPGSRDEYERRWAGLRAHNRWLVDWCADAPGRRAGVAQVMLYDILDAADEVVAIRDAGLTGGVLLPMDGTEGGVEPLHSPEYEPLWAVCEDLGVPVHRHASEPSTSPDPDRPELIAIGMAEYGFWNHRGLAHLIFSGVFERHPRLKFVFAETGIQWVTPHLQLLDGVYGMGASKRDGTLRGVMRDAIAPLRLTPSEYFRQNCYIGASTLAPYEIEDRHRVGVDRIMWGIDYPHAEGCFPYAREAMRITFGALPEPEIRAMLGETAADVYGFDLEQLQPTADRVGPSVAEVAEPLTALPRVPEDTYSAVFDAVSNRSL